MLSTIIVDDEPTYCECLATLIKRHCPDVQVDALCHTAAEALQKIPEIKPALVLLDIKMQEVDGFELLEKLSSIPFDVIVITGYDNYAVKAFRYNAVDYLLKPVDTEQLKKAVDKVRLRAEERMHAQLELLTHKVEHLSHHGQIALPTFEGLQMVNIDNIISCASDSNYTKVFLKKGQKLVVSKTLGDVEELLKEHLFIRVHHSYLVNINEIDKYVKLDGGHLVMTDGSIIQVSRHKRELLLKKLTNY